MMSGWAKYYYSASRCVGQHDANWSGRRWECAWAPKRSAVHARTTSSESSVHAFEYKTPIVIPIIALAECSGFQLEFHRDKVVGHVPLTVAD